MTVHDDKRHDDGQRSESLRLGEGAQWDNRLRTSHCRRVDSRLERWLAAEDADDTAEAEGALAVLFSAWPNPLPRTDFAERVLIGAGLRPLPAVYPWWSRAVIAVCLLLAGLATAYVLPLVFNLVQLVAPSQLAGGVVQTFVGLLSRFDELLAIWRIGARMVAPSVLIATSPQVVLMLLALTASSVFIFRGLNLLLSPPRSSGYVQAH